MSDPVSNVEIEDVLSSIRRLVSTENRGQPAQEKGAQEAAPAEEDKLVLTPSFRIDSPRSDDDGGSQAQDIGDVSGAMNEDLEAEAQEDDEDPSRDDSWSSGGIDHEVVDEGRWADTDEADGTESWGDATDFEAAGHDEGEDDEEAGDDWFAQGDETDDESWETSEPEEDTHDVTEMAEAAQDDAGEARHDETLSEPAKIDTDTPQGDSLHATDDMSLELTETDGQDAGESADGLDELELAQPDQSDQDGPTPTDLETRIAEVEAAVAARDDQWEPDGESGDAYAGGPVSALPWVDHATVEPGGKPADEAEILSDPEPEPEPVSVEAEKPGEHPIGATPPPADGGRSGDEWYADDAILDEEALRDLVSNIVREELQGALGERITRNVRKLVRREIHRALMSQDFD